MTKTTKWPQRFGTLTSLVIKSGRHGPYALMNIDCGKFSQTVYAFGEKLVSKTKAAGIGSQVWVKGPIDAVIKYNENGKPYKEESMRAAFFKDNTEEMAKIAEAKAAAELEAAKPVPQDLTLIKGIGAALAQQLNDYGVINFAQLMEMTNRAFDDIKPGYAKRAVNGNWRDQAAELNANAKHEARMAAINAENAFA